MSHYTTPLSQCRCRYIAELHAWTIISFDKNDLSEGLLSNFRKIAVSVETFFNKTRKSRKSFKRKNFKICIKQLYVTH